MLGFHHIGLRCADTERTLRFYLEAFEDAKVVYSFTGGNGREYYMVDIGKGAVIELLPLGLDGEEASSRWAHVAIRCDDARGDYDRLLRAGAAIQSPLEEKTLAGEPPCPFYSAFLYGPEGEIIELFQPIGDVDW